MSGDNKKVVQLRKAPKETPGQKIGRAVDTLVEKGFHGKVEIAISDKNAHSLKLQSTVPVDKLSTDMLIFTKNK